MNRFFLGLLALLWTSSAFALDVDKLEPILRASPQLDTGCSAEMVYSHRDEKTGDVLSIALTAKHCIEGDESKSHTLTFPVFNEETEVVEKKVYSAKVRGFSYKSDLALIEITDKDTFFPDVVKIAPKNVRLKTGEETLAVGYPLGLDLTVTSGLFGSIELMEYPDPKTSTKYYRSTPLILPGNSGGGLYHKDSNGDYELIGVATASVLKTFVGFWTPLPAIREYLDVAFQTLDGWKSSESLKGSNNKND